MVATLSDPDGDVVISTWQWQYANPSSGVCRGTGAPGSGSWTDISGATSGSYTPKNFTPTGESEVVIAGKCLRATATYTDGIVDESGDNTEPDKASDSSDAAVQLSHADNSAPKFPDQDLVTPGDQSDSTSRSVAENTEADKSIGAAVTADDADETTAGRLDKLLYTLSGTDAASFKIDRRTGQIKTKAALDYETKNVYMVTVTATDPSGATDSIAVTINVTDEDDGATIILGPAVNTAPAFDADTATFTVDENMPVGTSVGTVTATDEDAGDTVTYSDASTYFDVSIDGEVKTALKLDYEAMGSHTFTVTANDGNDENNTDTITVTVTVGDMYPGCTVEGNNGLTNDCEVLLGAKDELRGTGNLDAWSESTAITTWSYVTVSGDPMRVTEVRLSNKGDLDGSIPAGLADLDALVLLYLNGNRLSGNVPGALGGLANLEDLRLHNNELDGLETGLGGASSLDIIFAHRNHLKGSIPADLGDLDNLRWLRLDSQISKERPGDGLTGGIPAALADMDSITNLYLHRNKLSGEIPAELGSSTTLRYIRLDQNDLSGNIPDLSGMTSLVWLGLYDNDLDGLIPATLGSLSSLQRLYLHNNDLTGAVPTEIGSLTELTNLWLKNNRLSGDLPSSLANLTNLERVRIIGNGFTGCIPAALANAASTDATDLGPANLQLAEQTHHGPRRRRTPAAADNHPPRNQKRRWPNNQRRFTFPSLSLDGRGLG